MENCISSKQKKKLITVTIARFSHDKINFKINFQKKIKWLQSEVGQSHEDCIISGASKPMFNQEKYLLDQK